MTDIAEGENAQGCFMVQNFENTERWEQGWQHIKVRQWQVGIASILFSRPISLYSPSTNYKVYPLESFTLYPFDKMLVSWYRQFVLIHVVTGIHETINNNHEDLKHYISLKFHPFNYKNIAYKSIQPETCFGNL